MSYLALYRKYRPSNFCDLVGQLEVSQIIKNEILNDKLSHAYLFSGPRGTGKTSTAKIIARMINCSNLSSDGVPCGTCESCLNFNSSSDVVEIDAASNNGVDEIRELRDKVNLVPSFGKYKVYIIDEVHMLTTSAFNALLKTLEEPPAHVIFILATTEFYKIPATIVSRCQKFQFLKFSDDDIVNKLKDISSKESISVSDEVLYEIARLSDGGLRDAINMLDQLASFKCEELTVQDVYQLNGVISYQDLKKLLVDIHSNSIVQIINFLDDVDKKGKNIERFIEDLIVFVKDVLIYSSTSLCNSNILEKKEALVEVSQLYSKSDLYNFIVSLNDLSLRIKNSSFGKILLVTEFIKISNSFCSVSDNSVTLGNLEKEEESAKVVSNDDVVKPTATTTKLSFQGISDKVKKIRVNNAFATASKSNKDRLQKNWYLVEETLSNDNNFVSIAGMMKDVEILVVGDKNITFLAQYDSLLERLYSKISIIEDLLYKVFHVEYKVVFLLLDEWNYEKGRYIENMKSGKKYEYIKEECDVEAVVDNVSEENDVDKLVSIFGSEIISYK